MMRRLRMLLAACAVTAATASPSFADKASNSLRWASVSSITAVDPYYNAHREAMIINGQLIWDTLIYRDPVSGEFKPLLAKSWKWLDDVTLQLSLRDDVKFHDGRAFSADDVVYTINYVVAPENKINVPSNVNWMKSAEKIDDHTVKIHLKAPFPPALEYLASLIAILPKDFFGPGGVAGAGGKVVGTGPYRLVKFTPGTSIEVELTGQYFKDSPKGQSTIKSIVYRMIPDQSTQMAELLSGGLDWIWYVPPDQAGRLAATGTAKVVPAETMRISYLAYNTREMAKPNPLRDPRVRQALAHAIDRAKLVEYVISAGSSVVKAPCYRTQFGCRQDVAQYDYDPAKAKKLLAEAGVAPGTTLELVAYRNREWTESLAGYLDAVGIKTNITFLQYAAARERVVNNTAHLFLGDWGSYSINDVSAILNNFFTLGPDDMAQDKDVSGWLKAGAATVDTAVRKTNYDQAVARIAEQLYWFPLWVHPVVYAHAKDLEFQSFPDENPRFFLSRWK
ncbi:ABC transporter substrate-binding protein [Prosthecomicrobium hirschii]|nr:ABC transporter substrate-binding protein [Prosthecomicrobium hirschii]